MGYERRKSGLIVPKGVTRRAFLAGLVAAPAVLKATEVKARLMLNQLAGFNVRPAAGLEFAFLQRTEDTSDAASYTFTSENFGAANAARRILISAQTVHTAAAAFSCLGTTSIGGITATVHTGAEISHQPGGSGAVAAHTCWFSAVVPTGTTGNVVVNYSESTFRCIIGVYRVVGLVNGSPTTEQTSSASPGSLTLNIPANGFGVGALCSNTGTTTAWTGLANKDHDALTEGSPYTGASESVPGGAASRVVTATMTSVGTARAMGGLSWA